MLSSLKIRFSQFRFSSQIQWDRHPGSWRMKEEQSSEDR